MSLTDSPDRLHRAEDKAWKMLFPSPDEPIHNTFDEFFEAELNDLNNDESDKASPLDDLFSAKCNSNSSQVKNPAVPGFKTPGPWRKGLWCLKSKPNTDLVVGKTRALDRLAHKFVSPVHLVNNGFSAHRSPTSPTKPGTKGRSTNPKPVSATTTNELAQLIARDQTLSPTPTYTQKSANSKMSPGDQWQQDFQNFHLQMPDHGTYLSPQHTEGPGTHEVAWHHANSRVIARNATIATSSHSPTKYHYPFSHVPRTDIALGEADTLDGNLEPIPGLSREKRELRQHDDYPQVGTDQYGAPVWITESLHSSDSSYQSRGSQYSGESYQPRYNTVHSQAWRSPAPGMGRLFSPVEGVTRIAAPVPQRVPHPVLHHHQDRFQGGLGIQYAATGDEIGAAVSHGPPYEQHMNYSAVTPPPPPALPSALAPYPPLPPYPDIFLETSPFTSPHRHNVSHSRSPSPSISPMNRSASYHQSQCSPTRSEHNRTRRKSIHKSGPIKESSSQDERRRSRSLSRPPKTPRTPKTPTSATTAQMGFVNFTPKDSAKLMSDVAPSGSSKTRARREQEAKEKRKRLSEAALFAIRQAGGDPSALEDAIFI